MTFEQVFPLAATAVLIVGFAAQASGQDRMPAIPADTMTEAQRKAVEEFKTERKVDISGPFVPLLRSPELMNRARAMGDYLRFRSALPPRLSEFMILLTARSWTQQYEWFAHRQLALDAGVSPATVAAISDGRRPAPMTEDEEALYVFFDEITRTKAVTDPSYARMVARFGEQGVIDAAGIIGYYTTLSIVMNTARTAVPESGATTRLPLLPR